ncbi:hypothetical protein N7450_000846 [Penicillium hetheringtonii]|nr:hypothetical protein N7450_000846 [Penicillium hetheringtonii]
MHFVVTDANFPDDTPTECNLIWSYGSSPKQGARCNNSYYNIGFPEGVKDLHKFKLSLVRDPESPITERGQVSVDSHADGSKWKCVDNPEEHVKIRCNYEGTLEMPVSV